MTLSVENARVYIDQLDLNYLADAMCSDNYPMPRWTRTDVTQALKLYKNFLLLHKLHQGQVLVPTREIDECWHNHILYTKKYTHDCLQIFGNYLHHSPAAPGEDDSALIQAYTKTKSLYYEAFKEPLSIVIDLSTSTP